MTKTRSTKRALLMSALALLMCVSMLVGSTFAWFTDSVTSAGNKIQAGTLQLDLELLKNGTWTSIKESREPLFNNTLWEPGYTEFKILKVENEGTLALKWVAKFTSQKELSDLAKVIDVYVLPSETELAAPANRDLTGYTKVGTLDKFINTIGQTTYGNLTAGQKAYLGIALKMQETAGNEYQGLDLGGAFDITIFATQLTSEKDSFDINYDADAQFSGLSSGTLEPGQSAIEIPVTDGANTRVGMATVPAEALAPGATTSDAVILPTDFEGNFTIDTGMESKAFDITVTNLKENNDAPVKVKVQVGTGMDPATFKLYHYNQEIPCTYDPYDGYVAFESVDFSPFTIVYDAESVYVAPVEPDENDLPVANVSEYTPAEPIVWGNYGQWSPTEGLEANLDAIYKFACAETLEEAEANPYAHWECDFFVKLDRDLGANEIFLGGNYGDFGWVGFHNGDLTLEANTEIPLLGSVTSNPWTYLDVVQFVGEFICGVGNVGNSLEGATFTVTLRLTNPENHEEFYDIQTITYKFTTVVNSADELQDAINNGSTDITLGGDIDLGNGGLIIP